MKTLLITLLALGLAVALGHFITEDPGFVVIGYAGKVIRTSFVFFFLLIVTGIMVAYGVIRLVYLIVLFPKRWGRWTSEYRSRRSSKALGKGMVALAEGDYVRAEQLFGRGVDADLAPAARYLGAAQAAQALNAPARRDSYLRLAHEALPDAEAAIGTKRAQMQIENRQYEQARATLKHLADRYPDNKQVLGLLRQVYTATSDWDALLELLPILKRYRVCDKTELEGLGNVIADALLSRSFDSSAELDAVWERIPRGCRQRPGGLARYAGHLNDLGRGEEAEGMLRKALAQAWEPGLVSLYGVVCGRDPARQLDRAEGWLATHANDSDLLLTLARLSLRLQLWGKARSYLEQLIKLAPSPLVYRLIGETAEHMGDRDAAVNYHRQGLVLATAGSGSAGRAIGQAAAGSS